MEGLIGLPHDPIGHGLVDRQVVEHAAVIGLEALLVGDGVELVEAQPIMLAQVHGLLGDVLEDLTTGEVADVAGVVVAHQQLGALLGNAVDAGHILLGTGGGADLVAPVGPEVEGEVLLEGFAAVEGREVDWSHHGMVGEAADLLLHGAVHKPEVGHQGAIAGLIHHTLEEAAHETGVLGHGVGLLRSLTELGSQGDRHLRRGA